MGLGEGLVHYIAASVALTGLGTEHHIGRELRWQCWARRAVASIERYGFSRVLKVAYKHALVTRGYSRGDFDKVAAQAPEVVQELRDLGMEKESRWAGLASALALKALGRKAEALEAIDRLLELARSAGDDLTASLCHAHRSELVDEQGRLSEALEDCRHALFFAQRSDCDWAVAAAQAALAEILRDHGQFDSAIEGYRAATNMYETLGMRAYGSSLRVIFAETLVLAGKPLEAAAEVLKAVPTIERENMTPEGRAAVGVLLEAFRCHKKADSNAVRQVGQLLQLIRKRGRS